MILELRPDQLRRVTDPASLDIGDTSELPPLEGIIGQPRAVASIELGLNLAHPGFNVFVSGPPGIGKMTAVRAYLEKLAGQRPTPPDWCYVNNFADPYQPRALRLPPGQARKFQADIAALVQTAKQGIPKAFESEEYAAKKREIGKALDRERSGVLEGMSAKAEKAGHALQPTPLGLMLVPLRGKKPMSERDFAMLPVGELKEIEAKREALDADLKEGLKKIRDMERSAQEQLTELDRRVGMHVIGGAVDELLERYGTIEDVRAYLEALRQNMLENLDAFRGEAQEPLPPALKVLSAGIASQRQRMERVYEVNVLVEQAPRAGAPVVVEMNPTHPNLVGRVEREAHMGALHTDFTMIKAGSLHRANGGYLVLPVEDTVRNPFSWDALKRALRAGAIELEDLGERIGVFASGGLRPQPIPLDVKVVLLGRPLLHQILGHLDPEFAELFKVKADFDTRSPRTKGATREFLRFLCTLCRKEKLRPLDRAAAAQVLDHAARLAEDQDRLSLRFSMIADVAREADYWAGRDEAPRVGAAHVKKALDQQVFRSNLLEERVRELIAQGTLLVDLDGARVGQVNGLSVLGGSYEFGKPSRITASVAPGSEGIVDIEREVDLGGPIHAKGVLILSGYFAQRFSRLRPLNLSARLVFEQSYEGVEGDSASLAELCALLSALSGIPVTQAIAVTGSVNQNGEVQAIGGVNEKIEGFFEVCRQKGLTGSQGVAIPASNIRHLMLKDDVVEAVRKGRFHVWAVRTVDEAIELLTGRRAGKRGAGGRFPEGSVNEAVDIRLCAYTECLEDLVAKRAEKRKPRKEGGAAGGASPGKGK
ncbi:MAG: AAA family ATPase [Planctomycetia bacterium]|nr:AAA family ATPase [Planctomycetia bacterium]